MGCGTIRHMSFRDLDRLIELARAAERLAGEVERTVGKAAEARQPAVNRTKPVDPSREPCKSYRADPASTWRIVAPASIGFRLRVGICQVSRASIIGPCMYAVQFLNSWFGVRPIYRLFQTHRDTPASTSNGTPVWAINCFANSPFTNRSPRSNREYDFCEIARCSAASRWLKVCAARHVLRSG